MKIGIVALEARALFEPASQARFGGAEWRAATFAKGLAATGEHEITMVLGSLDPESARTVDGVRLVFDTTFPARRRRFPWLRWSRFRPSLLFEIPRAGLRRLRWGAPPWRVRVPSLAALELDAVLCFGVNEVSATVLHSLAGSGARRVLFLASDGDLDEAFVRGEGKAPYGVPGSLGRALLEDADALAVQRVGQQERLRERFGRNGTVIRNPIDLAALPAPREAEARDHVLWVGRADLDVKRPLRYFALARAFPEQRFVAIMNKERRSTWETVTAEVPPNVEIIERVPAAEAHTWFARACAFVNTSAFEGFPNTFLQAAALRVPILSLCVDPDGFLAQDGAGVCAGDDDAVLTAALEDVLAGGAEVRARVARAAELVVERHALAGRVAELAALLRGGGTG